MKRHKRTAQNILLFLSAAIILSGIVPSNAAETTPVAKNGFLKVIGNQLCNQDGQPVQLRGISSFGLQWESGSKFVNYDCLKYLSDSWRINVFRLAMYTREGGYIDNPAMAETVKKGVEIAVKLGIYVIIDWHILSDNDPNIYKAEAVEFFKQMAALYGKYPNVIYEICNEPNDVFWTKHIKPYAATVVTAIRALDKRNIIIVGTPSNSRDVDIAADDPLSGNNLMYACHFYAGSHGRSLRQQIDYARKNGCAVFITEWGTTNASGDGEIYPELVQMWNSYLNDNQISWCNWSLGDKREGSAILMPGANPAGNWDDAELTESGKLVKSLLSMTPAQ
jgi:endoglucanase